MGTTHVVGRRAVVFTDTSGGLPLYALFERTFDSGVFPRTPMWRCHWLGDATSCIQQILSWAKLCESGALQGRNQRWTAEAYIAKWRKELAAPSTYASNALKGRFVIDGYGIGVVATQFRDALLPVIALAGEHMDGNRFRIDLDRPGALQALAEATSTGAMPLRSLIDFDSVNDTPRRELGVHVAKGGPAIMDGVEVFFVEDPESPEYEKNYVLMLNGYGHPCGWRYGAMGEFIDRVVRPREAQLPGCAEALLDGFAEQLASAQRLPDDIVVRLDVALDSEGCKYTRTATEEAIERFGHDRQQPLVTTGLVARSMGELSRLAARGLACRFERKAAAGLATG